MSPNLLPNLSSQSTRIREPEFPSDRLMRVDVSSNRYSGTSTHGFQPEKFAGMKTTEYQSIMGQIQPYAVLSETGIVHTPNDEEAVPIEIATCLFNSTQFWIINTSTHVSDVRRQIQTAEMYWKSIVGADSHQAAGSADAYFANILNGAFTDSGSKTSIPHHYALVLREGSIIAGVLGRVPNGEVQAFDPSNEEQVASAEAANRLYTSLLNSINPEGAQLELIRTLWTGATTFINVQRLQDRNNPQVPVFTISPYRQVIQPGRVACVNMKCGFNQEVVQVTPPPPGPPKYAPVPPQPEEPMEEPLPVDLPVNQAGMAMCPACNEETLQKINPIVQVHYVVKELPEYKFTGQSTCISIESMLSITVPVVNSLDEATWLMRRTFQSPAAVLDTCKSLRPHWRMLESMGAQAPASLSLHNYADPAHTFRNAVSERTMSAYRITDSWEVTELYIDPREYACFRYDSQDNKCGRWLAERFPNGCRLTYVQGRLVKIQHADFHKQFFTVKHDWGAGLYTKPMSDPTIAANRVVNMMISMLLTTVKSGIGLKFVKASKISMEAIRAAAAGVNDYIPVSDTVGDMRDLVHQTDSAQIPPGLENALNFATEFIRPVNGTNDAITGNVSVETTLGGDEMRLNRALMQHHPLWGAIRQAWSKVGQALVEQSLQTVFEKQVQVQVQAGAEQEQQEQQVQQEAQQSPQVIINENIVVGANRGMPTLLRVTKEEQEEIKSGGWFVHIEESIPLTPSQIKAVILQLLQMSPDVVQLLLLNDPRNIAKLQEYILPNGFYTPGKDIMIRIQNMINLLKKEVPPTDPITGQVMMDEMLNVPKASRPLSAIDLDPTACWEQVRAWCQTREAAVLRGTGITPGPYYRNVLNWGYLNKSYVDFQMQQQQKLQAEQQAAQQERMASGKSGKQQSSGGSAAPDEDPNHTSELHGASALNAPIPSM